VSDLSERPGFFRWVADADPDAIAKVTLPVLVEHWRDRGPSLPSGASAADGMRVLRRLQAKVSVQAHCWADMQMLDTSLFGRFHVILKMHSILT
jgi:hypothetical protein